MKLLTVSCIGGIAVLDIWAVRGGEAAWRRFGLIAAIVAILAYYGAHEPIIFIEGHLLAVLAIEGFVPLVRGEISFTATRSGGLSILACVGLLMAQTALGPLQADVVVPWRWFMVGLGAGVAAVIIDIGMRRRRFCRFWTLLSGGAAVAIACLTGGLTSYQEMFAAYLKYEETRPTDVRPFSLDFGLLAGGTLCYWLWRWLIRAARQSPTESSGVRAGSEASAPPAQNWKATLRRTGFQFRRVLRLLLVWPPLAAISIFLFTPFFEACWRMPPREPDVPRPIDVEGLRGFQELGAFADSLDWSLAPSRRLADIDHDEIDPFVAANRDKISRLDNVLDQSCVPALDYHPLAISMTDEQYDSINAAMIALFVIHSRALVELDGPTQYDAARRMLLLARPLRRNGLLRHYVLGRASASLGMRMAFESRPFFDDAQLRSLIEILQESAAKEETAIVIHERHEAWVRAVLGWRDRLERACYPWIGGDRVAYLMEPEREHQALRATLICELAASRHALAKRGFPAKLDELSPEYVNPLPLDPYSGEQLRIHRADKGGKFMFFIYSVGWNGKSEDGTPEPRLGGKSDDISIAHSVFDPQ